MTTLQEYLDSEYPNEELKKEVEYIKVPLILNSKEIEGGELKIDNYPNLKGIELDGSFLRSKLTKLEVSNCPALTVLLCHRNQLTSLSINGCLKLDYLNCSENKLNELDLTGFTQLKVINCQKNSLVDIKFPESVEVVYSSG